MASAKDASIDTVSRSRPRSPVQEPANRARSRSRSRSRSRALAKEKEDGCSDRYDPTIKKNTDDGDFQFPRPGWQGFTIPAFQAFKTENVIYRAERGFSENEIDSHRVTGQKIRFYVSNGPDYATNDWVHLLVTAYGGQLKVWEDMRSSNVVDVKIATNPPGKPVQGGSSDWAKEDQVCLLRPAVDCLVTEFKSPADVTLIVTFTVKASAKPL